MNAVGDKAQEELKQRATILKQYETLCYRICYYLLNCENKALRAAMACIEHLFRDASFFDQEDENRRECIRKISIQFSLKLKFE